ncbi:hypothetical protein HDZ31DRAFT_69028 [Schizophyllum fasciatum]
MYSAQPMQHHDASAYGGWTGYSDQAQGSYADMERAQGQHGYAGEYDQQQQQAYAYTADTAQYAYGDHTQQHTAGLRLALTPSVPLSSRLPSSPRRA